MESSKSLREIEDRLPNGFHDAYLEAVALDLEANTARMDLRLSVGDPDARTEEEREACQKATLCLRDLVYLVIDPPGPNGKWREGGEAMDAGDATEESTRTDLLPRLPLPDGAFAHWFFVDGWNSFIHVAAKEAALELGEMVARAPSEHEC